MGTPRAVTYEQVEKAVGANAALSVWREICQITGTGNIGFGPKGTASIDVTNAPADVLKQVDALLAKKKPEEKIN